MHLLFINFHCFWQEKVLLINLGHFDSIKSDMFQPEPFWPVNQIVWPAHLVIFMFLRYLSTHIKIWYTADADIPSDIVGIISSHKSWWLEIKLGCWQVSRAGYCICRLGFRGFCCLRLQLSHLWLFTLHLHIFLILK